jgi:hypothetical protein
MFYDGHSIGEILNQDFLKLSYIFLVIQIIFHVFHLNEIQEENVTYNSCKLFFSLRCAMYFSFKTIILVVQVHRIIHHRTSSLLYKVYTSYFSSFYMFFFPILWCCSSGNWCFYLVWNFTKMQKSFWSLVPLQSLFNFFFKKMQFRVHASTSHQIITRLPKKTFVMCYHIGAYIYRYPHIIQNNNKKILIDKLIPKMIWKQTSWDYSLNIK